MHVETNKQVEHLVANIEARPLLSLTLAGPGSSGSGILTTTPSSLLLSLLLFLALLLELFPANLAKFQQAVHLGLHFVNLNGALFM